MKKYLYFILLLVLFIFPFNVKADEVRNFYSYPISITEEQKQLILNYIYNDSTFITERENYLYYSILFVDNIEDVVIPNGYTFPLIYVYFYNTIPIPYSSNDRDFFIPVSSFERPSAVSYRFDLSTNSVSLWFQNQDSYTPLLFNRNLLYSVMPEGFTSKLNTFYNEYYLDVNHEIIMPFEFNLYDVNGNFIRNYPAGTNIFYKQESNKEYNIEDILNSDDILYSLSKELIGSLPEEFSFIYSIVSLMLGILVLIVVISPFVILKRWMM